MAILIVGDRKVIEPGLRSLTDVSTSVVLLDRKASPRRQQLSVNQPA
jgi:hypothetical protein